jgi:hypothetical protein
LAGIIKLTGRYKIVNVALLREKASRQDPRKRFYVSMLNNQTYEAYLAEVGQIEVEIAGYKANPISGRMEILYCRRNGWIEDK